MCSGRIEDRGSRIEGIGVLRAALALRLATARAHDAVPRSQILNPEFWILHRCLASLPNIRYGYAMSSLLLSAGRASSLAPLLGGLLLLLRLARR